MHTKTSFIGKKVLITKADGTSEPFNPEKLIHSLRRVNASDKAIDFIVDHITKEIEDDMSTGEIYKHAFMLLRKMEQPVAARYSLRRSLAELGPSGFPFEKYIGEIFKAKGYQVLTDQIVQGACVDHEVDAVAWNENKLIMTEVKFHNEQGFKSDLKIALYVKARFDDLKAATFNYGRERKLDEGWLVTNTKFTEKAIQYGTCAGVKLIGWNYPNGHSLQHLIEDADLHPITCLTTLEAGEKRQLMDKGVVLCRKVREHLPLLAELGMSNAKIDNIMAESKVLCPID